MTAQTVGGLSQPRFPAVSLRRGHYESFYVRAVAPDRPAAVWIRYTVHQPPGGPLTGSQWCTLWQGGDVPVAVKQTFAHVRPGNWIEIGKGRFGPEGLSGSAQAKGHAGAWSLRIDPGAEAVRHLPALWLYSAALPRTKTLSPISDARLSGWVEVDGGRMELDGWRGVVGHNWGAEHAERWIWLHGINFAGAPEAWIDCVAGRVRIARWTTPWIANGVLALGEERIRVGGLVQARRTVVHEQPTNARLSLPAGDGLVELSVASPRDQIVAWAYADPGGGEHHALHCSVAAMELELRRPTSGPLTLRTAQGACYELGQRETGHGIPVQPFPDG